MASIGMELLHSFHIPVIPLSISAVHACQHVEHKEYITK